MERRLAAILAADVVGYSRLMGVDEVGTLAPASRICDLKVCTKVRISSLAEPGRSIRATNVAADPNCRAQVRTSW